MMSPDAQVNADVEAGRAMPPRKIRATPGTRQDRNRADMEDDASEAELTEAGREYGPVDDDQAMQPEDGDDVSSSLSGQAHAAHDAAQGAAHDAAHDAAQGAAHDAAQDADLEGDPSRNIVHDLHAKINAIKIRVTEAAAPVRDYETNLKNMQATLQTTCRVLVREVVKLDVAGRKITELEQRLIRNEARTFAELSDIGNELDELTRIVQDIDAARASARVLVPAAQPHEVITITDHMRSLVFSDLNSYASEEALNQLADQMCNKLMGRF